MSVPYLPENAPFTPAQRAWLNGFLAGLVTAGDSSAPEAPGAQGSAPAPAIPSAQQQEEEFPWHDPALSMDERLALAEGRSLERRLMAAMAQLDCGACGYLCQTYSEAIARGEERDLTRCAPGGADTARKLKQLLAAKAPAGDMPSTPADLTVNGKRAAPSAQFDRNHPFSARLLSCRNLNAPGSAKETRHIALSLKGSGLTYKPGDAVGILPENCPNAVHAIIDRLHASGAEDVVSPREEPVSLYEALLRRCSITTPTQDLVELLAEHAADSADTAALQEILNDEQRSPSDGLQLIELLERFPSARPPAAAFIAALAPLQPRLYSISSSLRAHPDEVHLTVGVVRYTSPAGRPCKGVASTYLPERIRPGQSVRLFIHTSPHFALPADGATPIIMVGPGTGIAPFRAFLQERKALAATGRNWLLFGDQHQATDFLYRDELLQHLRDGLLTRLDTAFSRDQDEKIYVQHRMLENAAEIWRWLEEDACFYVCGDARRMAGDVDRALHAIIAEQGGLSPEAARAYVADLARNRRYLKDVY